MKTLLFFLSLLTGFSSSAFANALPQLHQLQTKIQHLKNLLNSAHNQRTQLQHGLKNTEMKMSDLSGTLQQTEQQLAKQQALIKNLNKQQLQYQNQIRAQQQTLALQLRGIYTLGQQQYLKVLLNQEDPNQFSRTLTYYHYINSRRLSMIDKFNQTLEQLNQTKLAIEEHSKQLLVLKNQQQLQRQQLEKIERYRTKLLQALTMQIETKEQQLNTLLTDKIALEQVISRLAKQDRTNKRTLFPKMGKFPWPTHGQLIQHFGSPIQQSQLRASGVLIKAPEGQKVVALISGRVVYASWLSGYGLLLIVDDGNGLMTIYGRNHALYKKIGDTVKKGEVVSSVGNTGGFLIPALYFAIRKDGKPLNPELWCG